MIGYSNKEYAAKIDLLFKENSIPGKGEKMAAYMKHNFDFYGLHSSLRREVQSKFIADYGLPKIEDLKEVIQRLFEFSHREHQYFAIELAYKLTGKIDPLFIDTIEYMIVNKSWWDTVDFVASSIAGKFLRIHSELIPSKTDTWSKTDNLWLNRTTILFQLKYKDSTNTRLLTRYIEAQQQSKEFFIRKAIGWSLRQYSKTNKIWVKEFVESHTLSGLSVREATKYLD